MKGNDIMAASPFQAPLPKEHDVYPKGLYEVLPAFSIEAEKIEKGYDKLTEHIVSNINNGLRVLVIDGFPGVNWNNLITGVRNKLIEKKIDAEIIRFEKCLRTADEINKDLEPFLGGDDRIFGTHYPFGPEVFFDTKKAADLRIESAIKRGDKSGKLTIIAGTGASLIELRDELWYVDIPKDTVQDMFRDGKANNTGYTTNDFEEFYKRSYFIEWPAFNRQKKRILNDISLFIDGQNDDNPAFIGGGEFRNALNELSRSPFRVRPWFFPGPWGGQYMKWHMNLDKEKPNYAWSFELIVPENGVIFQSGGEFLECSFDFVMFANNKNILGEQAASQFKYEWPIRFDYLDTIDGGSLSTQVHPRPDYIKKEFGETYTQDETYYIVNSKPDSRVYIGLQEDCNVDEFKKVLLKSAEEEKEVNIEKYVNSEPSKPHDLFCVPNGTVHCSGAGNLVLEISATPYIFTFKIYDYLRRDLEGKLRPINIERGFANIRGERKSKWVKENLLAKPKLVDSGSDWKLFELYDKPFTFYKILRVEFETSYTLNTNGKGYAINLVEGETIDIVSAKGRKTSLAYIETMLIPSAAEQVTFINTGKKSCKLVLVHVKPEVGISLPVNDPND
ncbi:MAG: class I mannose-6-phosphate isomerase [Ignavibacteriales bacterium]|nr:class I mannose-6-phosphate isomerase [Ignavibacteriales bacterium]